MEDFHTCPICLEVPEKEMYQCSEGHTICSVCVSKLTKCPQCRVEYGKKLVRSRVLETLLDGQKFECVFKKEGCTQSCQRSEISNHATSCKFNPDLVLLCKLLGWEHCNFKIDGSGCNGSEYWRNKIINHFTEVHRKPFNIGEEFVVTGLSIQTLFNLPGQQKQMGLLCSLKNEANSPLFLGLGKINSVNEFISFNCILLWRADSLKKYTVDFSIIRDDASSSSSLSTQNSIDVAQNGTHKFNPLLISWSLNAYTPREAEYTLKSCPIGVHKSVFENTENCLHVLISSLQYEK